jgi:glycosyltransferase involved in cell wall biosynthesis
MCTYNGSRYLGEQLQSIAAQDHLPSEVIVCDDGSTDDTVRRLTEFASQAPFPVRAEVNKARLGPAKNFEKAIGRCQGDIIVLADQDDIWKPNKLKRLVETFENHPNAMYAFSDAEMIGDGAAALGDTLWHAVGLRDKLEEFSGSRQLEILLKRNYITGAALAFRASFRNIVLPIPTGWIHDYWIVLLGSAFSYGVPVPECLLMYRRHANQVFGWRKKTFLQVVKDSLATNEGDWRRKVDEFRQLEERVATAPAPLHCPADRQTLVQQKVLHLARRASIRASSGFSRIRGVVAEVLSGRYRRFSPDWYSIIRDL